MKETEVKKLSKWPKGLHKNSLLIYDKKLEKIASFKTWSSDFLKFPVSAGEKLKSLENFPKYVEKIVQKVEGVPPKELKIIAVGGGSVGDFSGFVASILKRGVALYHIPSTWLSAIDSAHGGKTALNVGSYKNQIGTFYPAERAYLVKELLTAQPSHLAEQAISELVKMALIEGRDLWKGLLAKSYLSKDRLLWSLLFEAVQAKYKVVKKDPYEKKGVRQVLNLGHTMGHFYEGHFGLSHGEAVGQGLVFALKWSQKKGYLSRHHFQLLETLRQMGVDKKKYKKVSVKTLEKYLKQDKKVSGQGEVRFVFVERPGKAPVVEVTIKSLIQEARRQGLVL